MKKKQESAIDWRIYYGDYSTFDSSMGGPEQAPSTGVICIVQKHPDYGYIVSAMKDYYWWADSEWWGSDISGFWQYMFSTGNKVVKFGQSIPTTRFNKIMSQATADRDFGVKSAKSLLDYDFVQEWTRERQV